jgi:hypothetical protein
VIEHALAQIGGRAGLGQPIGQQIGGGTQLGQGGAQFGLRIQ